jgi:hypothetical protein
MLNLEVVHGTRRDWVLQAQDDFGNYPTGYLGTDALSATCWAGQSQASLFAPAVSWNDAPTAKVNLSASAAQSARLSPGGVYQVQASVTRPGQDPTCALWVTLTCLPAAGSDTQATSTYCVDTDLLAYAPWLEDILEDTSDTEGFYDQRLRARQWLDRVIVGRARPLAYIFNIQTPLTPWGPVEAPNYVIQGYLQADYLLVRDSTIEIVARKAIAHLCEKQIPLDGSEVWERRARHFHATAANRVATYRAELNISSAPTVTVSDPTGAGAQLLATIANGQVTGLVSRQFGSGYTNPTFNFSGGTGNSGGIVATPTVSGGLITGGTVADGSSGFYQKQTPDIAFNLGMISWR